MNIQPISQNNISMYGASAANKGGWTFLRKISQKILDKIPNKTFYPKRKDMAAIYRKYESIISKPAENRLIMGATALLTQPAIDYYNHRVDDDTRTVSRNRTIAKIIAGTAVGAVVRGLCYEIIDDMTNFDIKGKHSRRLLPSKNFQSEFKEELSKLKNYKCALSTIIALGVMSITNLVIDAPLTVYLTNLFNEQTLKKGKHKTPESNLKGGINV